MFVNKMLSGYHGFAVALILCAGHVIAQPYHVLTSKDLPQANSDAAAGNPLKGFLTSPFWVDPADERTDIPSSLEFYYIGLNTTMTGNNTFDWTYLNSLLDDSASRNRHVILRFILHYPNKGNYVPQYLIDNGLRFQTYKTYGGGQAPDYRSPMLLAALQQFISAFGAEFDGDSRLAFIQAGLLGYWGEWHTYPNRWIPHGTKDSVVSWYQSAFQTTPVQIRFPGDARMGGVGLHDDSFAYYTLSDKRGASHWFWPMVEYTESANFWRDNVMGGELTPSLQDIAFSDTFPDPDDENQQNFTLCVDTTHATYIINAYAFEPWNPGYSGNDLVRVKDANNHMGYSFLVSRVEVTSTPNDFVDVSIEITQTGVAPFYYPLSVSLSCNGENTASVGGVENIVEQGETSTFVFRNVSSTAECLGSLAISLSSRHAYRGNPVKFSQGPAGVVELIIPPPPTGPGTPNPTPSSAPTPTPTPSPKVPQRRI